MIFSKCFRTKKIPGFFKTFLASEFRNAGGVFRNTEVSPVEVRIRDSVYIGSFLGFGENLENFWMYIYIYIHQLHIGYIPFGFPFLFFFHVPKTFWECKSQEHKDWNSNRHGHHGHIMIFAYFRQRCVPDVSLRCYGVADSTSPGCINAWVFFTTCHSGTVRVFVLSNKHTEKVGNLKQNKVAWTSPKRFLGDLGCACCVIVVVGWYYHRWSTSGYGCSSRWNCGRMGTCGFVAGTTQKRVSRNSQTKCFPIFLGGR